MEIIDRGHSTVIFLTDEEVAKYCGVGEGDNCCIWLVMGPKGFECLYYNRNWSLEDRWQRGLTVAKRDGCDVVKNLLTEEGEQ